MLSLSNGLLDKEWLDSVLSVDINNYNIITYDYNKKLFQYSNHNKNE